MAIDKSAKRTDDGVPRKGDANKEGVQVGNLYVYRVSESGMPEPGIEKDRNQRPRAHCGLTGVTGYVVNVRVNPSRFKDSENADFTMLEICLTKPAYGIRDAESEEAQLLKPGSLLLVPLHHALQALEAYAVHPTHTIEVCVIPTEKAKKPTAKGFFPWNWEVRLLSPEAVPRNSIQGLAALPALPDAASGLPALPA